MLITHFSGLIIGAGTSFASLMLGLLSGKLDKEQRESFLIQIFPLKYASNVGLVLLIASGLFLLVPYYASLQTMTIALTKLTLVSVLIYISSYNIVLMRRVRSGEVSENIKRLGIIGKVSFVVSVAVVFCAVYSFH